MGKQRAVSRYSTLSFTGQRTVTFWWTCWRSLFILSTSVSDWPRVDCQWFTGCDPAVRPFATGVKNNVPFFFFSSLLFLSQELLSSTFIWAFFFFLLLAPGTNRHLTRQMWHLVTLWWTVRPKQNISVPFTEGLTRGTLSSVAACVTNPVFNPSCSSVGHTLHCAALLWCWRDSVYLLLDLCVPTCESLMIGADLRMW